MGGNRRRHLKLRWLATILTLQPQISDKRQQRGLSQVLIHYRIVARVLPWIGIITIIVLSVVPANERPVTGAGHLAEHLAAFASVAAVPTPFTKAALVIGFFFAAELNWFKYRCRQGMRE
jgi:hypothetical protein